MEDFDAFLDRSWSDHASDPEKVADHLVARSANVAPDEIARLVQLGAHVFGEHLGKWQAGIDWLAQLGARADVEEGSEAAIAVRRSSTVLKLASGKPVSLDAESTSERVRIRAMAAAALAGRGELDRAPLYFEQALAEIDELAHDDPAQRAIAVTANNLAADLEEKAERTPAETELMLTAARAALEHWEIVGTWLHAERAEYRLVKSHLAAGLLERAREHATSCLALCEANDAPALELFWAREGLASVARASGDNTAFESYVAQMKQHLETVDDAVRSWCESGLSRLIG